MRDIDPLDTTPSASLFANQSTLDALVTEAVLGERLRIMSILTSDEAAGRTDAAMELALRTSMTPEEAVSLLSRLPKASSGAAAFVAALEREAIGLTAEHDQRPAALFGKADPKAGRLEEIKAAGRAVSSQFRG